jgi:hypothetical protein
MRTSTYWEELYSVPVSLNLRGFAEFDYVVEYYEDSKYRAGTMKHFHKKKTKRYDTEEDDTEEDDTEEDDTEEDDTEDDTEEGHTKGDPADNSYTGNSKRFA